ncbi:MAG: DUF4115 domain-containing protein [Candidatus Omnitrophica bacterium]|nr:DUF4115 domain-containing protein [Candidatus Omnitrophota bacterium]
MSESLGKTLKKIRESKHISTEEASEKTRIPKKIISTIEDDRLHEISSVFYARGFVKSYAHFLGALEENKVKEFLSTGQKKDATQLLLRDEKVPGDWFLKHKKQIITGILVAFSVWMLLFSLIEVGKFMRNASAKYKARAAERKKDAEKVATVKSILPESVDKKKVPAVTEKKSQGFEIEITTRYHTWIQVVSDGVLSFRGSLKKGTRDTWRAKKKIELELGNAGAVILSFNGKDLGSPGKKGEKKILVITEDGVGE